MIIQTIAGISTLLCKRKHQTLSLSVAAQVSVTLPVHNHCKFHAGVLRPTCVASLNKHSLILVFVMIAVDKVLSLFSNVFASMDDVKISWKNADAVCFDVDSTVIESEAIDELAAFCGKAEEVKVM